MNLIGNLPYNISNPIFFKIFENRQNIDECVFMIQKEVADRICSEPGNKTYGILSVLLQAFFDIEYLFTVKPGVFFPPPKVNSSVIRLKRNNTTELDCDEKLFVKVVKATFNKRRKTIKNGLKDLFEINFEDNLLKKRAEQLDVVNFVDLTKKVSSIVR
jgi:16S rRNA (adenine1518-N6/adenine1519-N6)-dimethyltransferase